MIAIGVVFYKEHNHCLDQFFSCLTTALRKSIDKKIEIKEIIFVLNSRDESVRKYLLSFLKVIETMNCGMKTELIQNSKNNIGLARRKILESAQTDWVYFVDPDVSIQENTFVILASEIAEQASKKWLGITGTISHESSSRLLQEVFNISSITSEFLKFDFQGTLRKTGTVVNHAPTAHLLLNKKVALKLGNFSSDYCRYGEDLDLTHRATQSGYAIGFGRSHVTHHQNFSEVHALKKFFNYGRVQFLVFRKNGFCRQRWYRLLPGLSMALAIFIIAWVLCSVEKTLNANLGLITVPILIITIFKPDLIFAVLALFAYGCGTIYSCISELNSLIAGAIFGKKSKKNFQRVESLF